MVRMLIRHRRQCVLLPIPEICKCGIQTYQPPKYASSLSGHSALCNMLANSFMILQFMKVGFDLLQIAISSFFRSFRDHHHRIDRFESRGFPFQCHIRKPANRLGRCSFSIRSIGPFYARCLFMSGSQKAMRFFYLVDQQLCYVDNEDCF